MDIFRVSFIGHRVVDEYRQVEEELDEVIELLHRKYGFIDFNVGRNGEFDDLATQAVRRFRREWEEWCELTLVEPYPVANLDIIEKSYDSFKDAIAPDSFEFRSDYFKVDGRYGRVMYLRDYANFITIMQTVREANAEYEAKIAEIKSQYDHDLCFVTGEPCEWSLAIAVYAIKTNRTEDVVTFDEKKAKGLKEVFHSLNRMDIHTKQITVKETRIETQDDGSVVPVEYEVVKTYLYVDTIPLTAAEAAEKYGLDEKQRKQLDELLSDRNKELWEGLLS